MKVVGFNGSPRKDGNTTILINYLLGELQKEGIDTELVQLAEKDIHGCIACYKCFENKDQRCAVKNDSANEYIEKIITAQGIILGSPAYFQNITTEMKSLIDRAGFVGLANDSMYKNKIGAALCCIRRGGGISTIDAMSHFFFSNDFIMAGRVHCVAPEKGDVEKDAEGIQMAKTVGKRTAWLLKKIYG